MVPEGWVRDSSSVVSMMNTLLLRTTAVSAQHPHTQLTIIK